jgi:hypothetical protein
LRKHCESELGKDVRNTLSPSLITEMKKGR